MMGRYGDFTMRIPLSFPSIGQYGEPITLHSRACLELAAKTHETPSRNNNAVKTEHRIGVEEPLRQREAREMALSGAR